MRHPGFIETDRAQIMVGNRTNNISPGKMEQACSFVTFTSPYQNVRTDQLYQHQRNVGSARFADFLRSKYTTNSGIVVSTLKFQTGSDKIERCIGEIRCSGNCLGSPDRI